MKRFSQLMPAGVPVEFDYPARSFTLLGCITPVDVRFGTGSQTQEVAEGMTPGLWYEAETPFRKVVITSPTDQVVSFLVSMGRSGWALPPPSCKASTTSLLGLAASGLAFTEVLDLGDNWGATVMGIQLHDLTASAGGILQLRCSDDIAMTQSRVAVGQGYNGIASTATAAGSHHLSSLRPTGRFVRGEFTNGATPQGASARMTLLIMSNVTA